GWGTLVVIWGMAEVKTQKESRSLFRNADVPVPLFPQLPDFETLEPSGVRVTQIELSAGSQPGHAMSFRVYLPKGEADPKSLPCVLVAPAGTNLLSGAGLELLDENTYHDEALPYAEAGMAVVLYSIDGEDPEMADGDEERVEEIRAAYHAFSGAGAGTVNGRNALMFVRSRLPMVDPNRIYSAGHSSAATLSLLLAAHEPLLKGCVAYAPAVDLSEHFADLAPKPEAEFVYPGIQRFVVKSSPLTHADKIRMPVFLFFAEDDTLATLEGSRPFIDALSRMNASVKLRTVPTGGHYESMIEKGIPAGIDWIRSMEQDLPPNRVE
ncbi:MAG: prolyl oligopeptidase family serine peptidase, partial [Verrucomicrobiae bacterium]|nr:prolyl oligopeptidase family serine peptidase [Verrucomicrobiae bacterium]